jgi:hypothetical protein
MLFLQIAVVQLFRMGFDMEAKGNTGGHGEGGQIWQNDLIASNVRLLVWQEQAVIPLLLRGRDGQKFLASISRPRGQSAIGRSIHVSWPHWPLLGQERQQEQ